MVERLSESFVLGTVMSPPARLSVMVEKAPSSSLGLRIPRTCTSIPNDRAVSSKVDVHEIGPGIVYQDVNVTAFSVSHGEVPHAFGYRFATPDRTIVISGDTSPSQHEIDACNNQRFGRRMVSAARPHLRDEIREIVCPILRRHPTGIDEVSQIVFGVDENK
jgi:hypothetical protein